MVKESESRELFRIITDTFKYAQKFLKLQEFHDRNIYKKYTTSYWGSTEFHLFPPFLSKYKVNETKLRIIFLFDFL